MVKVERSFPAPASLAVEAKKKTGSYYNFVKQKSTKRKSTRRNKSIVITKSFYCKVLELNAKRVE